MQSGWRLYAVMIGLAALTGTVVALALSGGPRLPSESPRRESPSASATATATSSATRSPSSQSSPTPTPTATPSPTPSDPLLTVKMLVASWRPTDTTAVVERLVDGGTRLIAVPLTASATTPIVELPTGVQWHLRLDGSALAVALRVGGTQLSPRLRIASLNLQVGTIAWVTPDQPAVTQYTPRWSNDGTVVYYARSDINGINDQGVYRVRVDGTNLTQLRPPGDRAVDVVGLTPDGLGLVLSQHREGGSVDVLDLNTRVTRSFTGGAAFAESWRPQRPRALISVGGPAGGRSQLTVWDDLVPTSTGTAIVTQALVFGADWDPTATRVVVATSPSVGNAKPQLVTMDANGQNKTTLASTDGASNPYWLRAGIVYLYSTGLARPIEVRIAQPTGTAAPRTLFGDSDIIRLTYVSP